MLDNMWDPPIRGDEEDAARVYYFLPDLTPDVDTPEEDTCKMCVQRRSNMNNEFDQAEGAATQGKGCSWCDKSKTCMPQEEVGMTTCFMGKMTKGKTYNGDPLDAKHAGPSGRDGAFGPFANGEKAAGNECPADEKDTEWETKRAFGIPFKDLVSWAATEAGIICHCSSDSALYVEGATQGQNDMGLHEPESVAKNHNITRGSDKCLQWLQPDQRKMRKRWRMAQYRKEIDDAEREVGEKSGSEAGDDDDQFLDNLITSKFTRPFKRIVDATGKYACPVEGLVDPATKQLVPAEEKRWETPWMVSCRNEGENKSGDHTVTCTKEDANQFNRIASDGKPQQHAECVIKK